MASHSIQVSGLTGRYATALFDLALAGGLEKVAGDVADLLAMLKDSEDLRTVVMSQKLSRADQSNAILAIADKAKLSDLMRRFLGVMAANRRLSALEGTLKDFNRLLAAHKGELEATVTSAVALSKKQKDALSKKLKLSMGRDVLLSEEVDESLLGGLIVKVGSRQIDSSLKTKLSNLKVAMKGVQ